MFRNILKTDLAEDVPIGEINPVTGRIYAGPKYGEIDKDEYERLRQSGALGYGQQAVELFGEGLLDHASNLGNQWETKVGGYIPDIPGPNEKVKGALSTTKNVAGHVYNWTLRNTVDQTLDILGAPVEFAHMASKLQYDTESGQLNFGGRGIGRAPLGIAETILTSGVLSAGKVKNVGTAVINQVDEVAEGLFKNRARMKYAYAGVDNSGGLLNQAVDNVPLNKPFYEMTHAEGVAHYNNIKQRIRAIDPDIPLRAADKDSLVTRIGRLYNRGELDKLTKRELKALISTHKDVDPVAFVQKYHSGELLNANSHHVLDVDFWGRALDTKHGEIVNDVLYRTGTESGNSGKNLVSAWSGNKGAIDHDLLHKMYDRIPDRIAVEALMKNGRWYTMTAKAQAKYLKSISMSQFRITNNFFSYKLATIKRQFPELAKLSPKQLQAALIKDSQGAFKYGRIKVDIKNLPIDHLNPNQVEELYHTLNSLPNTGGTTPELRTVFGLDTQKSGAINYWGSSAEESFNRTLDYLLNTSAKKFKAFNDPTNTFTSYGSRFAPASSKIAA